MKGITTIELNQETLIEAVQQYFTKNVFDASQLAKVTKLEPERGNGYAETWTYKVTIDSTLEASKESV